MTKIKFTKGELKRQRDSLKQFKHYLPTLQLKKQQLQMKILETRRELAEKLAWRETKEASIARWIGLLADYPIHPIRQWVLPRTVDVETVNIAGANVPVLKRVNFPDVKYDYYEAPFWLDQAVPELKEYMSSLIEIMIIEKRIAVLEQELRVTTQRVNLFEKIKIPECQNNIRIIRIYLGDQQANAVGISKVAKKKVEAAAALQEAGV